MIETSQLQTVLQYLPDPAFVITRSGYYAAAFGGRDSRYYHDGSPLVGLHVHDFMQKKNADWLVSVVVKALQTGRLEVVEYELSGKDLDRLEGVGPEDVLWFEARIQALPFTVGGEDAVLWVASNITARHTLEEELKNLSNTDPLTGLYNRRFFEAAAEEEVRKSITCRRPLSIMIADVDHFKSVNDTYGHNVGDAVLKDVAGMISRNLRRSDLAARWGGEEFVVAMSDISLQQAMLAGERLRRAVNARKYDDRFSVSVSVGVAQRNSDDESLSEIIERADSALYEAKSLGRNRVCKAGTDALRTGGNGAKPLDAAGVSGVSASAAQSGHTKTQNTPAPEELPQTARQRAS